MSLWGLMERMKKSRNELVREERKGRTEAGRGEGKMRVKRREALQGQDRNRKEGIHASSLIEMSNAVCVCARTCV